MINMLENKTMKIVNGNWTDWQKVRKCSFGGNGVSDWFETFQRNCTNPEPKFGGLTCYEATGESYLNYTSCQARKSLIFFP